MKAITMFILCLLVSIICLSLAIPVPSNPPQPTASDLEAQRQRILLISRDVLRLMEDNPFDSVGVYTISGSVKKDATLIRIPSWNDIEYSLGIADSQRDYFIFRKVFKALNRSDIKMIRVYPLPTPDNLKV